MLAALATLWSANVKLAAATTAHTLQKLKGTSDAFAVHLQFSFFALLRELRTSKGLLCIKGQSGRISMFTGSPC